MYYLYIEGKNSFSPDLVGEYGKLEDAQARAKKEKLKDEEITYIIEETGGGFNSYGEQLTTEVERG